MVSESEALSDDNFPFEIAYTVQKLGMLSDILDDKPFPLEHQEHIDI